MAEDRGTLKPCPFCGGKASIFGEGAELLHDEPWWVAGCDACHAKVQDCPTPEIAAQEWNRRSGVSVEQIAQIISKHERRDPSTMSGGLFPRLDGKYLARCGGCDWMDAADSITDAFAAHALHVAGVVAEALRHGVPTEGDPT